MGEQAAREAARDVKDAKDAPVETPVRPGLALRQ
jgi:hypothetical protein